MSDLENDVHKLQQLEDEKRDLENRVHNGYKDATRVARLRSEIGAVEERITHEKQRPDQSQG